MRVFVVGILSISFVLSVQAGNLLDAPGSVSGDCISGFSSSGGDPVLGSIAVAEQSIACITKQSNKTVATILEAGGFDKTLDQVKEPDTAMITLGTITGRSGTCPDAQSVSVFGKTITISNQPICDVASMIGWFMLLASVVIGAKILVGSE